MAVQREIVDKDGNRLAVVQGGAGKAAVYGKTAAGEWVPLQVDAAGRAVLNNVTIDEAWIQDVTVTAGSNVIVGETGDLSSRRITFAVVERAQAAHKFQIGYRPKLSGSNTSLTGGVIMSDELTYFAGYVHFDVEVPRYYVYIKNSDTVDHTYNVYKYEFAN